MFYENLKKICREKKTSPSAVATAIGMSKSNVTGWKNGLPHISFHRLRHISASVGASLNIPTKEMQERGGWKTDYTMKRVYTHTFTENRKQADAKMDQYFQDVINANAKC